MWTFYQLDRTQHKTHHIIQCTLTYYFKLLFKSMTEFIQLERNFFLAWKRICWWNCSSLIQVDTWTGHLESLPSNSLTGIGNIDVVVVWRARWAEHLNLCVDSGKLRRLIPPERWESWPLLLHWLQRHLW